MAKKASARSPLTSVARVLTPDETALLQMQSMHEDQFRRDVVEPLLRSMGTHVQEIHGTGEEGKDFLYVVRDHLDEPVLEVCQVKNTKYSGSTSSSSNVNTVLRQLLACVDLEVLNPVTLIRERPQSVCLITAFPLPDGNTKASGPLLDSLRKERCKIVGPAKLLELLARKAPAIYSSLAFPGQEIVRALAEYVSAHHEASAFNLPLVRRLDEFFIDLDLAAGTRTVAAEPASVRLPITLPRREYDQIIAFQSALPPSLHALTPVEIQYPSDKKTVRIVGLAIGEFNDCAEAEACRLLASASKGEALALLSHANSFMSFLREVLEEAGALRTGAVWPSIGAPIDSVPPNALIELGDSIMLVAEVGSGKTSLSRSVARAALAAGVGCVYFPCFMIAPDLTLKQNITEFLKGLAPGASIEMIHDYIENAQLLIIDGLDEAPRFGADLKEDIASLYRELAGDASLQTIVKEKASAFSIPPDLSAAIDVVRMSENSSTLRLAYPVRQLDLVRLAEGNPAVEAEIRSWAADLAVSAPTLLMTTRDDSLVHFPGRLSTLSLSPFTAAQLEAFLFRWVADEAALQPLLDFLSDNPHIREACRRPMVATLLASMHASGVNLPRSKSELYERHFELLLERWDKAKGLVRGFAVTSKDKLSLLSRLALNLHMARKRTFTAREFSDLWADGFKSVYDTVDPLDLLEELRVGNGVVSKLASDSFSLGHLSFQEYLTANGAVQSQQEDLLVANFYDPWWREVLVFYAGLRGDISSMLERLQRYSGLRQNHGLLDEMIAEARFTSQVVKAFIGDADVYLSDGDEPSDDADAYVTEETEDFDPGEEENDYI